MLRREIHRLIDLLKTVNITRFRLEITYQECLLSCLYVLSNQKDSFSDKSKKYIYFFQDELELKEFH
jgi:hypothetical protein